MIVLHDVIEKFAAEYGEVERPAKHDPPIDELIQTVLSQNTSDINTSRAFDSLKRTFPEWDMVLAAPVEDVIEAIRIGGLAEQKAPRIQTVLRQILTERGTYDLWFLKEKTPELALDWLVRLPGVGPKTAACTLLFGLDMPVMPVDTHVHRVSLRLGLVPAGTSPEKTQTVLGKGLTSNEAYRAHMLLIRHGRITCKARRPRCADCVVRQQCPYAKSQLA